MDWKLENGRPVTQEELAAEITRVPRTRFWHLSHVCLLWPQAANPGDHTAVHGGFQDGFALELVAVQGGVEWILQPVGGRSRDRVEGEAPTGRSAVAAAFAEMERRVERNLAALAESSV